MQTNNLPKVLLTGFTEFSDYGKNPSEFLLEQVNQNLHLFPGVDIHTRILDVDYIQADQQFDLAVAEVQPDLVVSFGLSWSIDEIKLERFALNIDDASLPDNTGLLRQGSEIIAGGECALRSSLPLATIYDTLVAENIPVKFSNHAGAYLCNHIFYHGLNHLARYSQYVPFGFIHLPPLQEQVSHLDRSVPSNEQRLSAVRIIVGLSISK